jgi:hypothetical protein
MIITQSQNRRRGVRIVIEQIERLNERVVYVKEMAVRWTIKDPTVLGDSRTYQLVWYLSTRIAHDNPSVANLVNKFL